MRILLEDYKHKTCMMEATMLQQTTLLMPDTKIEVSALKITDSASNVVYILENERNIKNLLDEWLSKDTVSYGVCRCHKVFINPNFLDFCAMETMITTHPAWFEIVDYAKQQNTNKGEVDDLDRD